MLKPAGYVFLGVLVVGLTACAGDGITGDSGDTDRGDTMRGDPRGGDVASGDAGGDTAGGDTVSGDSAPGDTAPGGKVVFVTSSTHNGALGGTSGADAICATRATDASLTGTFSAWVSTAGTPVSSRLAQAAVPYVRTDGVRVADNWTDLTDGTLAAPINRDENGTLRSGDVWTGTLTDGSSFTTTDCGGFMIGTSATSGLCGNCSSSGSTWTDNIVPACSVGLRLYCFEQ